MEGTLSKWIRVVGTAALFKMEAKAGWVTAEYAANASTNEINVVSSIKPSMPLKSLRGGFIVK